MRDKAKCMYKPFGLHEWSKQDLILISSKHHYDMRLPVNSAAAIDKIRILVFSHFTKLSRGIISVLSQEKESCRAEST